MRKLFLTFVLGLAAIGTMSAQKSVYVYRNDGADSYDLYENVTRLECKNSALTDSAVLVQQIVTADSAYEIPVEAIDSIYFDIPASFPRKHLIEEFTGQTCGYCPYGMDCISQFMENDTNFILILHHYGYQQDHFSVTGSKTITNALGVSGAPSAAIDRAKTRTGAGNAIVFHPGYLPETSKEQFAKETYASVNIANEYNAETRELTVTVSGAICKADYPALNLTVIVKESGMIDTQSDYYNTYEGWAEFRHCNAVRAFLTAAKGDALAVDSTRHYSVTYTTTLKEAWVPENCMVVAFIGESFKPVIQVEDEPVVAGTAGGDDIEHGGIKAVDVPDYYPEPGETTSPADLSGRTEGETMSVAQGWYSLYSDYTFWQIQAYGTSSKKINNVSCVPFAFIYLYTEPGTKRIAEGTYEINNSAQPGTVMAGFRDDSQFLIDGSMFYFTNYSYLQQGYLVPEAEWLIAEGTMTIDARSWTLEGKTRNGSVIKLNGTTAIQNGGKASAPSKVQKRDAKIPYGMDYCE